MGKPSSNYHPGKTYLSFLGTRKNVVSPKPWICECLDCVERMDKNQAMIKGHGSNDVTVTLLGLPLEYHGSKSGGLEEQQARLVRSGLHAKGHYTDDDGLNIFKSPILQYPWNRLRRACRFRPTPICTPYVLWLVPRQFWLLPSPSTWNLPYSPCLLFQTCVEPTFFSYL